MKLAGKTYDAAIVVTKPAAFDDFYGFLLLVDMSLTETRTHDNLVKAMNVLGSKGWGVVEMFAKSEKYVYALLYRQPPG